MNLIYRKDDFGKIILQKVSNLNTTVISLKKISEQEFNRQYWEQKLFLYIQYIGHYSFIHR